MLDSDYLLMLTDCLNSCLTDDLVVHLGQVSPAIIISAVGCIILI